VPQPENLGKDSETDPHAQQINKGEPEQPPMLPLNEKPRKAERSGVSQHRRDGTEQLNPLCCLLDCVETFRFAPLIVQPAWALTGLRGSGLLVPSPHMARALLQ
jgi:hypothetical protein